MFLLLVFRCYLVKFICSIITWNNVLTKINIASKVMQESDSTLPNIVLIVKQMKTYLPNIRTNKGFKNIFVCRLLSNFCSSNFNLVIAGLPFEFPFKPNHLKY